MLGANGHPMKSILTVIALLNLTAAAYSQTVSYVVITRSHDHSQTAWSAPGESSSNPWQFGAFVVGTSITGSDPITNASFTSAAGSTVTSGSLTFDTNEWKAEYDYATSGALTTAFVDGNYTMTFNSGAYTTPTRALSSTLYPNVPQFTLTSGSGTWVGNMLYVNPGVELVFTTNTYTTNFLVGSTRVGWDISGNGYNASSGMGDFSGNSATITISAGSLIAGNTYDLYAEFGRILDNTTLTSTGITGLDSATFATMLHSGTGIQLYAVPEPASYAMVLGTVILIGSLIRRRRIG
jgi:hypothetical protein